MIYAIETTGCGKRTRYAIKAVDERGTIPINYVTYRTYEDGTTETPLSETYSGADRRAWER